MDKIKVIAFDLDHTLYDRDATWGSLLPLFCDRFSGQLSTELSREEILTGLRRADFISTYEETHWKGMYAQLLRDGVIDERLPFDVFNAFIFECFSESIVTYEDTYSILTWCRQQGYRPSLITNGYPELQERKLRHMGLAPYLDEIIICDLDRGMECKPAPAPFWILAERMGIRPEEMIYVGDNPVNDMQGARNAGTIPVWFDVMHNWPADLQPPVHVIHTLSQLPDVISAIESGE